MTTHQPKFQVVQLTLNKKRNNPEINFEEQFKKLFDVKNSSLLQFFIHEIDTSSYFEDKRIRKALTAYTGRIDREIIFDKESLTIEGFVNGGTYGRKRTKAELEDKKNQENINFKDVIGDDFYFVLYLPPKFRSGVLVFQSYSDNNILDTFVKFLKKILSDSTHSLKYKTFLPKKYKELFENNCMLKDLSFNSQFTIKEDIEDESVIEVPNQYKISIKIEPVNNEIKGQKQIKRFINKFLKSNYNKHPLENFSNKKISLKTDGVEVKNGYYVLGEELKIRPIIVFDEPFFDKNNDPMFTLIKEKCYEILSFAKKDIGIE